MVTQLNIRLRHLMVPLLLLAGCDDSITSIDDGGGDEFLKTLEDERAPLFSGPDVAVFGAGLSETVHYYCEHPDKLGVAVQVLNRPASATVSVSNDGGDYKKKIAVTWSANHAIGKVPNPEDSAKQQYVISMLCRSESGKTRSRAKFDVYVTQ